MNESSFTVDTNFTVATGLRLKGGVSIFVYHILNKQSIQSQEFFLLMTKLFFAVSFYNSAASMTRGVRLGGVNDTAEFDSAMSMTQWSQTGWCQ